ncbi:ATP-dependent nuclease [Aquihabitans sp. McL0605]|uniref:ATP-dependent nuclease n=1 Tax=Aquihabitans sp. McL0605 TaxID=3415671 RepID=UPI003CF8888C
MTQLLGRSAMATAAAAQFVDVDEVHKMEIRAIRVQNYKSIHDSGRVTIEPDVTSLVGKNESGKTSLLEALYRLDPVESGLPTTFDPLRDYPRRFYGRDKASVPGYPVVEAELELSDADVRDLESRFGTGCVTKNRVTVRKGYANSLEWEPVLHQRAVVERFKSNPAFASIDVEAATTIEELRLIAGSVPEPQPALEQLITGLAKDPMAQFNKRLWDLAPAFILFTQYHTLPGAVSIRRLQSTPEQDLQPDERTALSLLRLAGVATEEFNESNYEARKAALEAAANTLTDEVFEFWTQNTELEVELDIEFRPVAGTPAPADEPWLQIRIRNTRHRVTLNFSERSAGFIWFFSFLAYFSEFRDEASHVLLLDEPGLNLHATAQADLLRYIEKRLAPDHQVIYTTHSPFMVQANHLERARLVEDVDRDGTKVVDDALGTTEETQFPLHAAIGMEVTQTLFIGAATLIVEGNADLMYIQTFSRILEEEGRTGLDAGWTVLPVGGLDKMPTFMALLTPQVYVVAVHDGAGHTPQRLKDLVDRRIIDASQLLALTDITGTKQADIEDMLDETFYLELVKASQTAQPDRDAMRPGPRIVPRIEAQVGPFSHYAPARHLADHEVELRSSIPDATLNAFEQLFEELNGKLAAHRSA